MQDEKTLRSGRRGRRAAWLLLALLLLGAALAGIWALRRAPVDAALARGNGRLEAVQIDIASRLGGRVVQLAVDEGEQVRAGQILLRLDPAPWRAQWREAAAQLQRSRDAVHTADAQLRLRGHDRAVARAVLAQREAERVAAAQRLARSRALLAAGGVSAQQLDDDRARAASADGARDAARAQLAAAGAALDAARAQRVEAQAAAAAAAATVQRLQLDIDDCTIRAASSGRVEYVIARPGEVIAAGAPLLGLVDVSHIDFVFFLPEQDAGRIALHAPVRLRLDAFPQRVLPARVTYVSSVAQFTPKTVETETERQKMMFRVKARLDPDLGALPSNRRAAPRLLDPRGGRAGRSPDLGALKSGMPGVAYLRRDATPWPAWLRLTH